MKYGLSRLLGLGLGSIATVSIIGLLFVFNTTSQPYQPGVTTATVNAEDAYATLCAQQTAQGREYVMLYDIFGTSTPIPALAAVATSTPMPTRLAQGDAVRGETVFNTTGACNACHRVDDPLTVVGPSLMDMGLTAANRVPGQDAETYLHLAILNPNEFVPEGFIAGIMPTSYEFTLSAQDIADLVAYMLTLKTSRTPVTQES
jgi:mono/diheme cytochrome c family protein